MKIVCSVEVLNRALPSLNMRNGKAQRSSLIISKSPDKDFYILHQTNQNFCGKKYKIKDNIKNVFVKFIDEGKATIRFKEPEHDLAIRCDPIQLKAFLRTLKMGLNGVPSHQMSNIYTGSLQKKTFKPVKTKLKITSKEEYPILEGFPRTLESLFINNASQNSLDTRILRLRNLRVLDIASNNLTTLPEQLGPSLPNLTELYIANNTLGYGDWKWIVNSKLQKQLKLLDLRSNRINILPDKLTRLVNIVTLKLDDNVLEGLPNGIGYMKNLRYFSASNNYIQYLPGSIFLLKLESIDLSGNPFYRNLHNNLTFADFQVIPSLVDITASYVISKRLCYSGETLPQTLIDHLESASFCLCGKPCFSTQPESYIRYQDHHSAASTVVSSVNCIYTVTVRFCSLQCYNKHKPCT